MINQEILVGIAGLQYRNCITVAYLLYSAHLLIMCPCPLSRLVGLHSTVPPGRVMCRAAK